MNEELRIVIRAVADPAKKAIADVKKGLQDVNGEADKAGKGLNVSMATVAKGAAIAAAAITALTAAMVALGKSANEAQKGFAKLNTTFLNNGSTTKQAAQTYEKLFGFLGDHDRAIETAQSLALITTEEEKLAEWSTILQGAFAEMGDKLPIEGLAEAANETINVGQVVGVMADALNWAKVSEDEFNAALAQTNSLAEREALVRGTLNSLYSNSAQIYEANNQASIKYNQSQAHLNQTLAQASAYTLPLLTALNNLSSTLLTALAPALQVVATYLTAFVQLVVEAIKWVGGFFGLFSDSASTAAISLSKVSTGVSGITGGLKGAAAAAKELKKQTMGFDELNIVSSQTSTGSTSGGGGASGVKVPSVSGINTGSLNKDFIKLTKDIDKAKTKIKSLLPIVSALVVGFGAIKLANFIKELGNGSKEVQKLHEIVDKIGWSWKGFEEQVSKTAWKEGFKEFGNILKVLIGKLLAISGAIVAIYGASKSWVEGLNWKNLITMLGGVAAAIAGVALAFGAAQAAMAAVVAGVVVFLVSLKDIIDNGWSVENVIGLIAGALLVLIPIIVAFNTTLLGNPIMLVVAAIAALVVGLGAAAVAIATEEKAIKSAKEAQEDLNKATEIATAAKLGYADAVDASEDALQRLKEAEENAQMSGEDLFNAVENGTLDYKNLTDVQKELYKAYIDNEIKQQELEAATKELTEAKKAEKIAHWDNELALAKESGSYDDYKASVVDAYKKGKLSAEEARDAIGKSMSEMSRSSQTTFMKDLPDAIKKGLDPKQYETFGQKISKWFGGLWDSIKTRWNSGTLFTGTMVAGEWVSNGSVPKMATGGIVTSSTLANIGEAGREAVLPLENNTGWMDTLADRIASRNGAPGKIVLELDGKELGYATINSINDITRQTGSLQLAF